MMRVCLRYFTNQEDALDCLNLSFVKIVKNLDHLTDIEKIAGWIKQIAVNTSIDK
jgi:DNA-directed RNA polymerase specialized sigma24 family protein